MKFDLRQKLEVRPDASEWLSVPVLLLASIMKS